VAEVPLKGKMLRWAIDESGFRDEEIAGSLGVELDVIRAWVDELSKPNLTQFRRLAAIVKRPTAVFFLPAPPAVSTPKPSFRRPMGSAREGLLPKEIVAIRDVQRIQGLVAWSRQELGDDPVGLPHFKTSYSPEAAAKKVRQLLGISIAEQRKWKTPYVAARAWRAALEDVGALVFFLPLGANIDDDDDAGADEAEDKSVRGFSVWNDFAPAIAINTAWNPQARIFSMLHELGHLVTRSDSSCVGVGRARLGKAGDNVERWCEKFAAAVLLPWDEVSAQMRRDLGWEQGDKVTSVGDVSKIAGRFRASLSATAIRMIEQGAADWPLFDQIPKSSDAKKGGGGAAEGRKRGQIRRDEYGVGVTRSIVRAVAEDVITRDDALSHLRVSGRDLDSYLDVG